MATARSQVRKWVKNEDKARDLHLFDHFDTAGSDMA